MKKDDKTRFVENKLKTFVNVEEKKMILFYLS